MCTADTVRNGLAAPRDPDPAGPALLRLQTSGRRRMPEPGRGAAAQGPSALDRPNPGDAEPAPATHPRRPEAGENWLKGRKKSPKPNKTSDDLLKNVKGKGKGGRIIPNTELDQFNDHY